MNRSTAEAAARMARVLEVLAECYGTQPWNWHTRQTPFQILIGTVLSHRTRDPQTDLAAQALFARYPGPKELAAADPADIQRLIRPVNYHQTKAKRIQAIARIVLERFAGVLPADLDQLLTLPGVGRKTASCVMVYGFHRHAVAVDTHVHRISNRLGVVATRTPEQTERALLALLKPSQQLLINDLLVKHGQTVCSPRQPRCGDCPVRPLCRHGLEAMGEEAPEP